MGSVGGKVWVGRLVGKSSSISSGSSVGGDSSYQALKSEAETLRLKNMYLEKDLEKLRNELSRLKRSNSSDNSGDSGNNINNSNSNNKKKDGDASTTETPSGAVNILSDDDVDK